MKIRGKSTCVVVPALVVALALLSPQRTHAFSLCDYIDFALKPFGWCGEEVEVVKAEDPTGLRAEQELHVQESSVSRELPVSLEHSEPQVQSATSKSYDPSLTHDYVSTSDWVEQSSQVNKLLSGIVTYLFGEQQQESETKNANENVEYVTTEFLQKQTDRIYDKRSDSFDALSDSFTTSLLTVSGSGTLNGSLTAGTYLSAPYLIATDTTATSTLTNLTASGRTALSGSLTLAALGGGLLTTDANGVVSTTTVGAASVTDDSLDFDKLIDAFTLDATATFDLDTNNADWNIDNGTFFVDADTDRVGIGTSTPETLLHVGSAASPKYYGTEVLIVSNTNGPRGLEVQNTFAGGTADARLSAVADDGSAIVVSQPSSAYGSTLFGIARNTASYIFNTNGTSSRHLALGTYDDNSLILGTDNTERMRIDENGNVGIGTTSPVTKMSVSGDGYITGGLGVGVYNSTDGSILQSDGTRGARIFSDAGVSGNRSILVLDSNASNGIGAGSDYITIARDGNDGVINSAGGSGTLSLQTANTDRLYITNTGNVGIGTTSPDTTLTVYETAVSNPLRVYSDTYNTVALFNSNDNSAVITVSDDDTTSYFGAESGYTSIGGFSGLNASNLNVNNTTGNVGIGTTSPASKLDVYGDLRVGTRTSGSYRYLDFTAGSASANIQARRADTAVAVDLTLQTAGGNTLLNPTSGNVGIGTTSPDSKLHVEGSANEILSLTANNPAIFFEDTNGSNAYIQNSNGSLFFEGNDGATVNMTINNSGNVGIGTTSPAFKLSVAGTVGPDADDSYNLGAAGSDWGCLYYNSGTLGTCASDERLKENIETLSFSTDEASALDQVAALSLHTFSFKEAPGSQYKGLIAQEVLEVAPELVLEREDSFLAVKYGDIQWLVLEAMQEMWRSLQANFARDDEQDAELEYLRERVTALEEELGLEPLAEPEEQDNSFSDPEPSSSNGGTPVQPASTDESESASSTESHEDVESQASSTEEMVGFDSEADEMGTESVDGGEPLAAVDESASEGDDLLEEAPASTTNLSDSSAETEPTQIPELDQDEPELDVEPAN